MLSVVVTAIGVVKHSGWLEISEPEVPTALPSLCSPVAEAPLAPRPSALTSPPPAFAQALSLPGVSDRRSFERAVRRVEAGIAARAPHVSHSRHLPRLLHHGRATDLVVVQVHGLYESPHYGAGLARAMHAQGANVLSVLLPGHWSTRHQDLDDASYRDWVAEVREAIGQASGLGKRVVLAGFSTGGLLAVNAALDDPRVTGLMLWSPALYLSQSSYWGAVLGKPLGLTLHDLRPDEVPPPDGYDRGYYSASAGVEVTELIAAMLDRHGGQGATAANQRAEIARRIALPTLMVVTDEDETVPVGPSLDFFAALGGPKRLVRYSEGMGVKHGTIAKAPEDVFIGWEQSYNRRFPAMVSEVAAFMRELASREPREESRGRQR